MKINIISFWWEDEKLHAVDADGVEWIMTNVYPTSMIFGNLDYDDSDIAEITLTTQYASQE